MTTTKEIRNVFLDYFKKNGHQIVASSSLVPSNDPSLMFTNAGMVQFKNVFTGLEKRDYKRASTVQKCVRAGGKHNDLDNVGYTCRHHTFFEMLGNFSFGDYFKEEAIPFAWNLITKELGLNPEKLTVTVYHEDKEAADIWKKVAGFSDNKIIKIATKDNFWSMGDTGPCGPCTEIFYDHGDKIQGGPPGSPNEDGDRFVEIWNLVFMQYEQLASGERINLPKPSIDTGMGLERVAAVLQGTHDNFETDIFKELINAQLDLIKAKITPENRPSYKVIADHIRSMSFLIADGVMPSNEGRGYVLRRIMRRAMRHAFMLGASEPIIYRLVPVLCEKMGEAYPELISSSFMISETIKNEEERFSEMLSRGMKLLSAETKGLKTGDKLNGSVAFKLYDTFGFPLDLTADALRNKGISVDEEGFNKNMQEQRLKAKAAWAGSGESALDKVWFEVKEKVGATEFLGYDKTEAEGLITAIIADGKIEKEAKSKEKVFIVTNQTPFYGESGGQSGDIGTIELPSGAKIKVIDTKKMFGDLILHQIELKNNVIKVGDEVKLLIDKSHRQATRLNHSCTHLLHKAMQEILGSHVCQKGSMVNSEILRFDFAHNKKISIIEQQQIETLVNDKIRENLECITTVTSVEAAKKSGAMALFDEKYGDEVRIVSMGNFSRELCGGTHVKRTGDIGVFKIIKEEAIASGIRRITAVTGVNALNLWNKEEDLIQKLNEILNAQDIIQKINTLIEDGKNQSKEILDLKKKLATGGDNTNIEKIKDINFIGKVLDNVEAKDLKSMIDDLKKKISSGVCVLISGNGGKASIVVGVTADLTSKIDAVVLVKIGAKALGSESGGGRADLAQGGGTDISKAGEAISLIKKALH